MNGYYDKQEESPDQWINIESKKLVLNERLLEGTKS